MPAAGSGPCVTGPWVCVTAQQVAWEPEWGVGVRVCGREANRESNDPMGARLGA